MDRKYIIPAQTHIGHVHLKVSNLERSLEFYCDLLGFEPILIYGDQAAFISAGGYHHHIGLNTWHSKEVGPALSNGVGLYHTAIVYSTRKDLAFIFERLRKANYPLKAQATTAFLSHFTLMTLITTVSNFTGTVTKNCGLEKLMALLICLRTPWICKAC